MEELLIRSPCLSFFHAPTDFIDSLSLSLSLSLSPAQPFQLFWMESVLEFELSSDLSTNLRLRKTS